MWGDRGFRAGRRLGTMPGRDQLWEKKFTFATEIFSPEEAGSDTGRES